MKIIQSKSEVKQLLEQITKVEKREINNLVVNTNALLLEKKIRFPLLEFAAQALYDFIPGKAQLKFTDQIIGLNTIGGNVIAGIILQLRLKDHFKQAHRQAVSYIIEGNEWYVCDIIGERVMGYSLLNHPEATIPLLALYTGHPDKWIVRSVGVATHYAVKKGLKKVWVEKMFLILLRSSGTTDFHTKKGIGWGAKTIAKFHPEIIEKYKKQIDEGPEVKQWFKSKIKIGLSRSFKYASRYSG